MSTVPAALTALRDTWTAAMPGVQVIDGPWLERPTAPDVLVVGWLPEEGSSADLTETTAGLGSDLESYDVTSLASSWRGDGDMQAARQAAADLLDAARAALKADQTLGGVVTRARLVSAAMGQYRTAQGAEVRWEFTVRVDAFRIP